MEWILGEECQWPSMRADELYRSGQPLVFRMGNYPWWRNNHKLVNGLKIWKGNGNIIILPQMNWNFTSRKGEVNTIMMDYNNDLFHKSRPANKQHTYQSITHITSSRSSTTEGKGMLTATLPVLIRWWFNYSILIRECKESNRLNQATLAIEQEVLVLIPSSAAAFLSSGGLFNGMYGMDVHLFCPCSVPWWLRRRPLHPVDQKSAEVCELRTSLCVPE